MALLSTTRFFMRTQKTVESGISRPKRVAVRAARLGAATNTVTLTADDGSFDTGRLDGGATGAGCRG